MIHRAIYGSFERMIAIMIENYAGKFPFFLSPHQIAILPVSEKSLEYSKLANEYLKMQGYYTHIDASDNTLNYKIRQAQVSQYNIILVCGEKEKDGA